MSDAYRVATTTVDGGPTGLGTAGSFSLVFDRPVQAGGRGLGFSVEVDGDFPKRGAPSTPISVTVEIDSDAGDEALDRLLADVDRVAEIPNSLRGTIPVVIRRA